MLNLVKLEIRNDKDGNIGVSIGKKSFHDDQLLKNYHAILDTLEKEKANNTLKGDLIKNTLCNIKYGCSYKVKLGKIYSYDEQGTKKKLYK